MPVPACRFGRAGSGATPRNLKKAGSSRFAEPRILIRGSAAVLVAKTRHFASIADSDADECIEDEDEIIGEELALPLEKDEGEEEARKIIKHVTAQHLAD